MFSLFPYLHSLPSGLSKIQLWHRKKKSLFFHTAVVIKGHCLPLAFGLKKWLLTQQKCKADLVQDSHHVIFPSSSFHQTVTAWSQSCVLTLVLLRFLWNALITSSSVPATSFLISSQNLCFWNHFTHRLVTMHKNKRILFPPLHFV